MKEVKGMALAMLPIALGVVAGMLIYEQVKKATAKSVSAPILAEEMSNVAGIPVGSCRCANGSIVANTSGGSCKRQCEGLVTVEKEVTMLRR